MKELFNIFSKKLQKLNLNSHLYLKFVISLIV